MVTYEQKLNRDLRWALLEGSRHFEKESAVHKTLERITRRLDELGVRYALVGAMAMFYHGYRRFTEDVDLLVNREGLAKIHANLDGRGYRPPFTGSKHLRDTETGVRVEFLVTGDYPGDGKPKSLAFPEPADASETRNGVECLTLPRLIELKLASGMNNPGRLKDLADVQQLIQVLDLQENLTKELHPLVQARYQELWSAVQAGGSQRDE
jgi:hypothetical protein